MYWDKQGMDIQQGLVHAAWVVHASCPCPCCMALYMLRVHVHAACSSTSCMSLSLLHVHVGTALTCTCIIDIEKPHKHVREQAAWSWTCSMDQYSTCCMSEFISSCMSMSILHFHVHAACPCPCCILKSMQHGLGHSTWI